MNSAWRTRLRRQQVLAATAIWLTALVACGQEPKPAADAVKAPAAAGAPAEAVVEPAAEGLVKLSKTHPLYLDTKRKAVVIDGKICLREGQLEMFACPKGTKEHESVVVLDCLPQEVHAALLALGAKPGTPVKFDPEYAPAKGDIVDIYVLWKDDQGEKHQVRAQEWVQNHMTKKALAFDWVFAGSGFWKDEDTGEQHYKANGGDFICVSNFPTAMLDLPVASSKDNSDLLFVAFTENIPPKGTPVRVVLLPRVAKKAEGEKPVAEKQE